MQKLIIANWKANPATAREAKQLFSQYRTVKSTKAVRVVVCPPHSFLHLADPKNYSLGVQDAFWEEKGAYTGEVSAAMAKSLGAEYVILGHSERRNYLEENDRMVNRKVSAALEAGLRVVLCVGERKEVRSKGLAAAKRFVLAQLEKGLAGIGKLGHLGFRATDPKLTIAYEPIWAIGTGAPDSPKETAEMAEAIRERLDRKFGVREAPVLYGGSVTSSNVRGFLQYKEINGALVGGASLKTDEFKALIKNAG